MGRVPEWILVVDLTVFASAEGVNVGHLISWVQDARAETKDVVIVICGLVTIIGAPAVCLVMRFVSGSDDPDS